MGNTKKNNDIIVCLARTDFRNQRIRFGIKKADRRSHLYVIGKTGTGKSTLLQSMIRQDIAQGEGLALFDPHGDLVDEIKDFAQQKRPQDLIYFDATAPQPLGFNPLQAVSPSQRSLAASGLLEAFKKLWIDSWGPRLEHILRNALFLLLERPESTLADILRLFDDPVFRKTTAIRSSNSQVRRFWLKEFEGYPARFRAEAVAPLQNKVGAFLAVPVLNRILTQPRTAFCLREIMDQGKILLVNLAKGKIGEDASSLLGALMVSQIMVAALSRAAMPESERLDFYVYMDEFQGYSTQSLAAMLSELRKYRVGLILAHQHLSQVDPLIRDAILGNAGTMICFRTGLSDAELLAKELYPYFSIADLTGLPNHHIYLRF